MVGQPTGRCPATLEEDKGDDMAEFVQGLRASSVTPHVAQNIRRRGGSTVNQRTTRHPGDAVTQCRRQCIREIFAWARTVGLIRQVKRWGLGRIGPCFTLPTVGRNLIRLRNPIGPTARDEPDALPLFA